MNDELEALLSREAGLRVVQLSTLVQTRGEQFPTFLQAGEDVHGSHMLFYWLRARGRGLYVSDDNAAFVLSWRADVARLVALRPVGDIDAIVNLLDTVAKLVSNEWPDIPLVVRYCGAALSERLAERDWRSMSQVWAEDAPLDDETHPEVIITGQPVEVPEGPAYRPVRKSILRHQGSFTYKSSPAPLHCGEIDFIASQAARAENYDELEVGFNQALVSAIAALPATDMRYHYLFQDDKLAGLAISANTTGLTHSYYMGTTKASRLSTYFQWLIYLEERRMGSTGLNLGGSETESLHEFKMYTFPEHELGRSQIFQSPCPPAF
ncbi:MAG: hypothetical protein HOQ05_10820 [Corynebacteriales bacterium]|nr:hypothetical protein [Mycobacteriales bacterium]